MDPSTKADFISDFCAAQQAVRHGISAGRARSTSTTWTIWETFTIDLGIDPFLQAIEDPVPILQVFAQRIRSGKLAANGNPVRARSAEDYLRFVAQTFLSVGSPDPRLNSSGKTDFRLLRMIRSWKREDPPPNRVKPVPVQVIRRIAFIASFATHPLIMCTSDMILLAFFFLLRPGEYTDGSNRDTNSQPFLFSSAQLFIGPRRLNFATATDAELLAATFGSLTFDNQKNGVRGEVIGLSTSGDPIVCPVRAIARRIIHLRASGAPTTAPLARCYHNNKTHKVTSSLITSTLRASVRFLGHELGFLESDISARCLRAAGANALLLAKVDSDIIRLIGRWRSDEMLRYLHVQAAPLMAQYSRRMLEAGTYTLIPNQTVPMR